MSDRPVRVQRSRQHKNVSPNGLPVVYVGRGKGMSIFTIYHNPFIVGPDGDRGKVVELYKKQIAPQFDLKTLRERLRDKNLSCWCPLDQPCHADVLLELANAPPNSQPLKEGEK